MRTMDFTEMQAAFFSPREDPPTGPVWDSPARRLRDAIEPVAMVSVWSEPVLDAYAEQDLDFLTGYVWGRASTMGEPDAGVVVATFGVFEPGLAADLYGAARAACSLADVRRAKHQGVLLALGDVLGHPSAAEELPATTAALLSASKAAPTLGRPLFAGLSGLPVPEEPWAALWHACTLLRELRGDGHLAAVVTAGLDGLEANLITEMWLGWEQQAYAGTRGWSPQAMSAALDGLARRGLVEDGSLSEEGRVLREQIEASTDAAVEPALVSLGDDLGAIVERLDAWGDRIVERGWFPPDPLKRAAG